MHARTVGYDLVRLDDHVLVVEDLESNRALGVADAFRSNFFDRYYRPLHRLSFALDARRGGADLRVYHRTNALLHVAGSICVFAVLRRLGYRRGLAAALGLGFAVHPALTSAVAWIPGRDNALVTVFLLGALWAWVGLQEARSRGRAVAAWGLHQLAFAGALCTKEGAVVFPAVALAWVALWQRRPLLTRRNGAALAGWLAVIAAWQVARSRALPALPDAEVLGLDKLLESWPMPLAVLGRVVLPVRLTAFADFEAVSIGAGLAAAVGLAVWLARATPAARGRALFGLAWLGILLAPTLLQRGDLYDYGEYRIYWLALGPLIVLGELLRSAPVDWRRPLPRAAAACVLLLLAGRTWLYQPVFDGELAFWNQLVAANPDNAWGWFHVGRANLNRGRLDVASDSYARAVEIGFPNADLYVDLAALHLRRDEVDAAAAAAREAIDLDASSPYAHFNLGSARLRAGAYREAAAAFEAAIAAASGPPAPPEAGFEARAWDQLGSARWALGERAAARRAWEAAFAADPSFASPYAKLTRLHLEAGDRAQAERLAAELARRGLRLPPPLRRRLDAQR